MLRTPMLGLMLMASTTAQAAPQESPTPEQAESLFRGEDWAAAAEAYDTLTEIDPDDGEGWFRLGYSLYRLREYEQAADAWTRALALDFYPSVSAYNLAAARALTDDTDGALEFLERSVEEGFDSPEVMRDDPDFAALRGDSRFRALLERTKRNARPCMYDPAFRQFDFWVGDWVVRDSGGTHVGSKRVKRTEQGCALTSEWTDHFGRTATALFHYDPAAEQWVQASVGAAGHFLHADGGLTDAGAMRLSGTVTLADGRTRRVRTTWTPRDDGGVHLVIERSADGRQWKSSFEGFCEPRRSAYGRE